MKELSTLIIDLLDFNWDINYTIWLKTLLYKNGFNINEVITIFQNLANPVKMLHNYLPDDRDVIKVCKLCL